MLDEPVASPVETAVEHAAPATVTPPIQPGSAVETPAEATKPLPFHEDPKIKEYLERQSAKKDREWNQKFQELKDGYTKQLELFNQQRVSQGKPEVSKLPPEQEQALEQLVSMLSPRLKEQLGLNKMETLEAQLASMSESKNQEAFESEFESTVSEYATKYGYDKKELDDDLREYIANEPMFDGIKYSKGISQKVAKLYFSDKGQELAERAANLKLIKEQKEKKQGSTEAPSKVTAGKGAKPKRLEDFLDERVSQEGGLKFD